jgi:hypothetical protein
MTVELNVSLDRQSLARFRRLMADRVAPAKSLTFVAEKARDDWREANHHEFHMRSRWLDSGVRLKAATPGNLVAQVGSIDKFFGRHVIGIDEPKRGAGGDLLIPIYDDIAKVPMHRRIRAMLRQQTGTRRKPFKLKTSHGTYLARRQGKGRAPLTIIGVLRRDAAITPRFDAEKIVDRAVRRDFTTVYERLLLGMRARQGWGSPPCPTAPAHLIRRARHPDKSRASKRPAKA